MLNNDRKRPVYRYSEGFSLIEVLIALLILAIGLLGVAAMQVVSLQQSSNSDYRTQANLMANELGEKARAEGNPGSLVSSRTDECSGSGSLSDWCESMHQVLPEAEYEVTWSAGTRTLDINLWWYEREDFPATPEDEDGDDGEEPEMPTGETMSHYAYQVRFSS